jgi:hypothetical protein
MQNYTRHNLIALNNTESTLVGPTLVHSGADLTLQNVNASGYIYVGSESVSSTSYGYRILPNHAISFELPGNCTMYAISSAPGMLIATMVTGLEVGD